MGCWTTLLPLVVSLVGCALALDRCSEEGCPRDGKSVVAPPPPTDDDDPSQWTSPQDNVADWAASNDPSLSSPRCNVERVDAAHLSREEFHRRFLVPSKPVVLQHATNNSRFRDFTQKQHLLTFLDA